MHARTIVFFAAFAAGCVDQDVDDNTSEESSDITVGGGGIVVKPDYDFHVTKVMFMDKEGAYLKPQISSGSTYTLAAINPTVRIRIELKKGTFAPASLDSGAFTDSYVYPSDPQNPYGPAPSNPMWSLGNGAFFTYFDISRWTNADRTWTLKGWVKQGGVQYNIAPVTIVVKRTSAFVLMNKTFDEERCQTCHSIDTGAKWKTLHTKWFSNLPDAATVDVGDHEYCKTCHHEDIVDDWRAPPASKNINWSILTTAAQRCAQVAANLPTTTAITNHFHNDPRLLWSYNDPNSACMYQAFKPLGPPIQDPDGFLELADYWRDNMHDCANVSAPRDPAL